MIKHSGKSSIIEKHFYPFFKFCPFSANTITIFSILSAFLAYLFAINDYYIYSILGLIFLAFLLDAVDGIVARAKDQVSKNGAFLDGIADRVVEFFVLLILLKWIALKEITGYLIPIDIQIISILFFGTCMASFVKAYAEHRQVLSHEKAVNLKGVLERAERVGLIFIALLSILLAPTYTIYIIFLIFILTIITFLQRIYYVLS
ncbi:CDP-alcohol phosphatidyltransferase family protein [Candidatus Micrarchaeota archaeon]|nr:CDP-alcohol phosphatidyltransferase family protein [Candidatus Micrarchaeota archaeon]